MTRLPVRLGATALEELAEAAAWYDAQSAGLGDRFLDAAQRALDLIAIFPASGALARGVPERLGARSVPVEGFPYGVIYRVRARSVRVFAFAHAARAPGYWRERR